MFQNDVIVGAYTVEIVAEVIVRQSQKVLLPEAVFRCVVVPGAFYYSSLQALRNQIEHLARIKYVYHLQKEAKQSFQIKQALKGVDWMVRPALVPAVIYPALTEELRIRVGAMMQASIFINPPQQQLAA